MEYVKIFKGFTDIMVIQIGKEYEEIKIRKHHLLTVLCTLTGVFLSSNTINIFSSTLLSRQ
jgi:hypothetical protein